MQVPGGRDHVGSICTRVCVANAPARRHLATRTATVPRSSLCACDLMPAALPQPTIDLQWATTWAESTPSTTSSKNFATKATRAGSWTTVRAPIRHLTRNGFTLSPLAQSTLTVDENEWDGAMQFGTFNRMRMCPVLEVSISGFGSVELHSARMNCIA